MRILHVVHQYPPDHVGGTELYTQWLTRALQQRGHEVAIFYRRSADGIGLDHREEDGRRIWFAWNGRFQPTNRFLSTFQNRPLLTAFEQVLAEFQPDIVHVQHLMGLPTQLLTRLRQKQIPYVVTLWDFWWVCANAQLLTNYSEEICNGPKAYLNCAKCALARAEQPLLPPLLPPLALPLALRNGRLRHALLQANQLIAPDKFVKQWYVEHGVPAPQITVAPPGLNYPVKPSVPAHDTFRVGYLGGLSLQKGVHILLAAFSKLPQTAELWIAGDLESDPDYVKQLKETGQAKFLGKLDRHAVWEMLSQLDLVVVPSIWYETFCFVISEAFAMGVPVIASDLGVLSERVRPGVDGLLVPPGDVAALAHALQTLYDAPEHLAALRQNILPVTTLMEHTVSIEGIYETAVSQHTLE
jgi:glycosyltransferase involved in cell wall biosynthesis